MTSEIFTCDSDPGAHVLVISFAPPARLTNLQHVEVDLRITDPRESGIPDWWALGPGECRDGSLAVVPGPGNGACFSAWAGQPASASLSWKPSGQVWERVLQVDVTSLAPDGTSALAGVEYGAARLILDDAHTGTCGGCDQPMDVAIELLRLFQDPTLASYELTAPLRQGVVMWQGGSVDATPPTWGRLRRMYR